jgi:predicted amidohydrolase YtcJ
MRTIIAAVAATLLAVAAAAQQADVVITNAKVWTGDAAKPSAEAIAIRGNRIAAVGTNAEIGAMTGAKTRRIDAGGRLVIPGLNDAHSHQSADPDRFLLSLIEDPSWADIRAGVVNGAEETPADTWIYGTIGPRALRDNNVNARALDEAAHGRKVKLESWTGHGMVLSTAAMRALGVSADERDPAGGWYERDAAGQLTGKSFEYAEYTLRERIAGQTSAESAVEQMQAFAAEALGYGITSIQNMSMMPLKQYAATASAANVPLRIRMIHFPGSDANGRDTRDGTGIAATDGTRPLTVLNGWKWILDGTPVEQGAALRTPYANTKNLGRMNFTSAELKAIVAEALASNEPMLLHAVGDATTAALFDAMKAAGTPAQWKAKRLRIEHGDGLTPDLIPIARELGVVVVLNPTHFFAASLYPKKGYSPAKSLLKAGVPIAIGSDGPMSPGLNLQLAIANPGNAAESLTREEALAAYTRGGAYAEFAESEKGTIAVGKLADLAILSQNVLTAPVAELPATTSVLTIVDGKVAHHALP